MGLRLLDCASVVVDPRNDLCYSTYTGDTHPRTVFERVVSSIAQVAGGCNQGRQLSPDHGQLASLPNLRRSMADVYYAQGFRDTIGE